MKPCRRWAWVAVAAGWLGTAGLAQADAAAVDERDAAALFQRAKQLYQAEKYQESYRDYLKAWALQKGYDIASNLGNVELRLGKHREAVEHLRFGLRNLPPTMEARQRKRVEEKINERIAQALQHLAQITLAITPDGAQVTVDGTTLGQAPLGEPLLLEPGSHQLEVRSNGYDPLERDLITTAGATDTVSLALTPIHEAAAEEHGGDLSLPLVLAGGGVAGAAIVTGAVLLGLGSRTSQANALRNRILPNSCVDDGLSNSLQQQCRDLADDVSARNTETSVGVGLLVGGGVLAAATAAYALWPRGGSDEVDDTAAGVHDLHLLPVVSTDQGGLWLRGRF